jgi:hypothetical protein
VYTWNVERCLFTDVASEHSLRGFDVCNMSILILSVLMVSSINLLMSISTHHLHKGLHYKQCMSQGAC